MKKSQIPSSRIFQKFGKYFPYPVVDVIIRDKNNNFLLTKRAIPPYKNKWHFPGGVICKNIEMKKMVRVIAKKEVNLEVEVENFVGVYEINLPIRHDISHAFIARVLKGEIRLDFQSTDAKFFSSPPNNMVTVQKKMWSDAKSILRHCKF